MYVTYTYIFYKRREIFNVLETKKGPVSNPVAPRFIRSAILLKLYNSCLFRYSIQGFIDITEIPTVPFMLATPIIQILTLLSTYNEHISQILFCYFPRH